MAKRAQRTKELTPVLKQYAAELFVDIVPNPRKAFARAHKALGLAVPKGNDTPYRVLHSVAFQKFATQLRETSAIKTDTILAATELSVKRTEREIARMAYVDIGELYRPDGTFKSFTEMSEDARRAIVAVETEEIFEYADDEDPATLLDALEPIIRDLLAALDPTKLDPTQRGLVLALKAAIKPPKAGKRFKHLVGHLKKVKLADKRGANELAGRRDGLFKDKMVHEAGSSLEAIIAASHKAPV